MLNEKLIYNSVPEWDSIGHMSLVSCIEEAFNISMETNDIMFKPNVTRNVLIQTNFDKKYNFSNMVGEDVGFVSIAAAVLRKHVQLYLDKNVPDEENKLGKAQSQLL